MVKVVVAKKRVPQATRLEPKIIAESFEIRDIASGSQPPDSMTATEPLLNRYMAMPILANDIMTPARLLDKEAVVRVSSVIPQGKRAVTIAVSKTSGVGGFIQQKDIVDVIATIRTPAGELISKIILQDVEVLAVGNQYEVDGVIASVGPAISGGKVDMITLAVSPVELEKLVYLETSVTFRLVLKNIADKGVKVQTAGESPGSILSGTGFGEQQVVVTQPPTPEPVKPEAASSSAVTAPPPPPTVQPRIVYPKSNKVEIWQGTRKQEMYKFGAPDAQQYSPPSNPEPMELAPEAPAPQSNPSPSTSGSNG